MPIVKNVVLALLAVILTAANFMFDLAGSSKGTASSVAMSASLGYALTPSIIGLIALAWKQHRNASSFLKVVCVMSALMLFASIGNLAPPPKT